MSSFLEDILAEPKALLASLEYAAGAGREAIERAAALVASSRCVYITGIGSSWHAGMAVQSFFDRAGRPAMFVDASELLHGVEFAPDSCLIALSRSGKSVEIVKLLDKADAAGIPVIGVTNSEQSPLANRASAVLPLRTRFDLNISVTMYTGLTLVGGLLAAVSLGESLPQLAAQLRNALMSADDSLREWQETIGGSDFLDGDAPTYFLARGASLASASETRLLWEEAAKYPATAMTSGGFRHGPQEILLSPVRVGMWLSPDTLREEDLKLAEDIARRGVPVMLIGQDIPPSSAGLSLQLPQLPSAIRQWQFLLDVMPAQLAAADYARRRGANSDGFAICPYIIESEGGLVGNAAGERA